MKKILTTLFIAMILCILLFAGCASDSSTDNTVASEDVEQTAASSEVSTEGTNTDKDGMRAAYLGILNENLEAMSSENIKVNKGSQMTALFDIDGDSVEELFLFIPNDDGVPVLHIFSYENGEPIDIVYDCIDRSGERVGFQANIVVAENKYTIFQSKDKESLYIYNADIELVETYEVRKYAIADHYKLQDSGHWANYYSSDDQTDEYYSNDDVISEEEFVKEFNDAADDMGEVIMNTADDDFAVSKAARGKDCEQKTYEEMIEYLE